MTRSFHSFIDGRATSSSSGGSLPVTDPSNGETVADVGLAGLPEVDAAVAAAKAAFPDWSRARR